MPAQWQTTIQRKKSPSPTLHFVTEVVQDATEELRQLILGLNMNLIGDVHRTDGFAQGHGHRQETAIGNMMIDAPGDLAVDVANKSKVDVTEELRANVTITMKKLHNVNSWNLGIIIKETRPINQSSKGKTIIS